MILFITKATFQHGSSLAIKGTTHGFGLFNQGGLLSAFGDEVSGNAVFTAVPPIGIGGINSICTMMSTLSKEFAM
jgi:hypothetical protein